MSPTDTRESSAHSGVRPATAVIADDEPALVEHLRRRLAELWPDLEIVAVVNNGLDASDVIERLQPTVAFLDIKMPGRSGLEVAQGIESNTRVVFVTAYDEYALEAFEREAVDYLVKPVDTMRLGRTVARLQRALSDAAPSPELAQLLEDLLRKRTGSSVLPSKSAGQPDRMSGSANRQLLRWIRASRGDTTYHVPIQDVLFFQSDDKYTVVQTSDGEYLIRTPLAELLDVLDPELFCQIHRSSIVNLNHVRATRRDGNGRLFVLFDHGDAELPVARAYAQRFRQM